MPPFKKTPQAAKESKREKRAVEPKTYIDSRKRRRKE
jgi:hypothetical protein